MKDRLETSAFNLSGGQQQRVGLARAIAIRPKLLLMDEPLSNLDAKLRVELRDEIRDLQKRLGITTLYVTHDQEEALSMSDRIAVMSHGVIEQLDEPRVIYDNPKTAFVAGFIGEMNFLTGAVTSANDGVWTVDAGVGVPVQGMGAAPLNEKVRVGLRPERLVVTPNSDSAGTNQVLSTVLSKMYLGDQIQFVVTLPSGATIVAIEQRASVDPATDNIKPGDRVTVSWDTHAPLLLGIVNDTQESPATPLNEETS